LFLRQDADMAIQRVVDNVGLAVDKPLEEGRFALVEHRGVGFVPVDTLQSKKMSIEAGSRAARRRTGINPVSIQLTRASWIRRIQYILAQLSSTYMPVGFRRHCDRRACPNG
jgi:hypothetical protein